MPHEEKAQRQQQQGRADSDGRRAAVERVCILGAGSAGFLAAIALRHKRPDVEVALIASSRLPPIGVGEGTTPLMVPFLHGYLGLDIGEFLAEVQPTFKLGVSLEWGLPGDYRFYFPFDAHNLAESYRYGGDINAGSFGARLIHRRAGVQLLRSNLSYQSVVTQLPYAYHMDNRRFVAYLQKTAAALGVAPRDLHIVDAERSADGAVAALIAEDGSRVAADLFIDCSGFSARLIGGALGVDFVSYDSHLFTDAAVIGNCPHGESMGAFTLARTMNAGWCWSLPQVEDDHRGYVFCSRFIDADEATAELRELCPGMGETRVVRFRSGRRERWWQHNVVAVGNSYGFVEPLEATALHMVVRQIVFTIAHLDEAMGAPELARDLNDSVASLWDNLSGLLALHYKYNKRLDTPFWRYARAETDLGALEPLVQQALREGPRDITHDPTTGTLLGGLRDEIDLLLMGMQEITRERVAPPLEPAAWQKLSEALDQHALRAISARDSVKLSRREPALADPRGAKWYEGVLSGLERPVGVGALA